MDTVLTRTAVHFGCMIQENGNVNSLQYYSQLNSVGMRRESQFCTKGGTKEKTSLMCINLGKSFVSVIDFLFHGHLTTNLI
jgi:hypothetical protein